MRAYKSLRSCQPYCLPVCPRLTTQILPQLSVRIEQPGSRPGLYQLLSTMHHFSKLIVLATLFTATFGRELSGSCNVIRDVKC